MNAEAVVGGQKLEYLSSAIVQDNSGKLKVGGTKWAWSCELSWILLICSDTFHDRNFSWKHLVALHDVGVYRAAIRRLSPRLQEHAAKQLLGRYSSITNPGNIVMIDTILDDWPDRGLKLGDNWGNHCPWPFFCWDFQILACDDDWFLTGEDLRVLSSCWFA